MLSLLCFAIDGKEEEFRACIVETETLCRVMMGMDDDGIGDIFAEPILGKWGQQRSESRTAEHRRHVAEALRDEELDRATFDEVYRLQGLETLCATAGLPDVERVKEYLQEYMPRRAARAATTLPPSIGLSPTPPATPASLPPTPPTPPDSFDSLRLFAATKLKGMQRAVVEVLCDSNGAMPIADLAVKENIEWEQPIKGFKSAQDRLKDRLKRHGWRLQRRENVATLVKIEGAKEASKSAL